MKALQREANRDLLAVCPPPTKLQRERERERGGGQNANELCKQPFGKTT